MMGWQQAGSESDNRIYSCHMPRLKPICTCWPMAPPLHPIPPTPSVLLTSLNCLEWVQMCDPQTLPLWSPLLGPQGSTKAGTQLEEPLAKVSLHTVTSFAGDCVRAIEVLRLNAGHFITQNDLTGFNLTAHRTQKWQVIPIHAQRQIIRMNINMIILQKQLCYTENGKTCISCISA